MRQLGERTAEISSEIHNISHRLHSAKLEALGLVAAVRGHCREVLAQGVQVHFSEVECAGVGVATRCSSACSASSRKGLNNVVKHSGAPEAHVTLSGTRDALLLSIADFGRGFDDRRAANRDGLGLESMRERLRLIGGELTIRSRAGHGTTIDARVPLAIPRSQSAAADAARRAPATFKSTSVVVAGRRSRPCHVAARAANEVGDSGRYDAAAVRHPPPPRSVADGVSPNTAL